MSIPKFARDYLDDQLNNIKTIGCCVDGIEVDRIIPNHVIAITTVPYGPYKLWREEMDLAGPGKFRLVPERYATSVYQRENEIKDVSEALLKIHEIESIPPYKVCQIRRISCGESVCQSGRCRMDKENHEWRNIQLKAVLANLGIM
jgi:hypothetical protein